MHIIVNDVYKKSTVNINCSSWFMDPMSSFILLIFKAYLC